MEYLTDEQHMNGTRTVFQFGRTICSTAYAVTLQAAIKLVEYYETVDANLDEMLNWVCSHKVDLVCLGVWPQIMTAAETKSNIDHNGDEDVTKAGDHDDRPVIVHPGPAIQYSAWRNARQIIDKGVGSADWIAEWYGSWAVKNGDWEFISTEIAVVDEGRRGKSSF